MLIDILCLYTYIAPILGHVGDGNFHSFIVFDPKDLADFHRAEKLADKIAEYVLVHFLQLLCQRLVCYYYTCFCNMQAGTIA